VRWVGPRIVTATFLIVKQRRLVEEERLLALEQQLSRIKADSSDPAFVKGQFRLPLLTSSDIYGCC